MRFKINDVVYSPEFDRILLVVGWADWLKKNVYQIDDSSTLRILDIDEKDLVKMGEL